MSEQPEIPAIDLFIGQVPLLAKCKKLVDICTDESLGGPIDGTHRLALELEEGADFATICATISQIKGVKTVDPVRPLTLPEIVDQSKSVIDRMRQVDPKSPLAWKERSGPYPEELTGATEVTDADVDDFKAHQRHPADVEGL